MKQLNLVMAGFVLILLAMVALIPQTTQALNVNGTIRLAPLQPGVEAGKSIVFQGTGFNSYERVDTWATDPSEAVIRGGEYAKADGRGNVTLTFELPDAATGGIWKLTAIGKESLIPVWASFEVYGRTNEATTFLAQVIPPEGPTGTTFTFTANGFDREDRVSYWVTGPDGQVSFSAHQGIETNRHGQAEVAWTAPLDAMVGRWVMTMQETDDNKARAIPFYVGEQRTSTPTPQHANTMATLTHTPLPSYTALPTYEALPSATSVRAQTAVVETPSPTNESLPTAYVLPLPTLESLHARGAK